MANIASFTVYDSLNAAHTFTPISVTREGGVHVSEWRELNVEMPDESLLSFVLRRKKLPSGIRHTELKLAVPVMESVSVGAFNSLGYTATPKVAFVETVLFSSYRHPRSTGLVARDAKQLLVNLLCNVATNVVAPATGVVVDAFVNDVVPS